MRESQESIICGRERAEEGGSFEEGRVQAIGLWGWVVQPRALVQHAANDLPGTDQINQGLCLNGQPGIDSSII